MDEPVDLCAVLTLTTEKLERPWFGTGFRLRSVVMEAGELHITFWWERNPTPFGVKLAVPQRTSDEAWTRWAPGSVDEWVEYAVRVTLVEELETGLTRRAGRTCSEGVTWLELDDRPGVSVIHVSNVVGGDVDTRTLQARGLDTTGPTGAWNAGRLLLWRYAFSGNLSSDPLGAISIESGDPPTVCTMDVVTGVTPEVTRTLLSNAMYVLQDMGWLTVAAPHGPQWLTSWGFVADSAGVLTLDVSSGCVFGAGR